MTERSLEERFRRKFTIDAETGCWLWTAGLDNRGYGKIGVNRRHVGAHRVSYELHVGPIPYGLEIDHLCRTPRCVNPDHLEPVTSFENRRRRTAAVTHCPQGHAYDAANTYVDKRGHRTCRACNRAAAAALYARKGRRRR